MGSSKKQFYRDFIKGFLDRLSAGVLLLVLSPVLLITALLVRSKLGSPVLFRQPRPGKNEKIFSLYKFRSMTNEIGEDGRLLPDSQRLTKFGKFLRSSSLDELPELINILKGDMSFVGPRPLSIYYLPHYPKEFRQRHSVRPGLTGLAQVNGRNNLPWDQRFSIDIEYVENISLINDIKILFQTFFKVLKHSDVSLRGSSTIKDYGSYCIVKEEAGLGEKKDGMSYSEIGSYFWLDGTERSGEVSDLSWLPAAEDSAFTFSGRNAIDLVLQDILHDKKIDTVYAPSYACVSMLQSFIDRGINIVFYPVSLEKGRIVPELPALEKGSVLLILSYFGLQVQAAHESVREAKKQGVTIIEDITHSLFHAEAFSDEADYLVASLRKWLAIPTGGWAGKRNGQFAIKPNLDSNHAVVDKIKAMKDKYNYLKNSEGDKESFLLANSKFDNDLIHVDRMLKIDDFTFDIIKSTDIKDMISRRRRNAEVLMKLLSEQVNGIITLPEVDLEKDVPLFLPIFLPSQLRDQLRKHLIENGIYCPVHWPEMMGVDAPIRENELSLICDQRYTEGDMRVIADTIIEWCKEQSSD